MQKAEFGRGKQPVYHASARIRPFLFRQPPRYDEEPIHKRKSPNPVAVYYLLSPLFWRRGTAYCPSGELGELGSDLFFLFLQAGLDFPVVFDS